MYPQSIEVMAPMTKANELYQLTINPSATAHKRTKIIQNKYSYFKKAIAP